MRLLLIDALRRHMWSYFTASLYFIAASSRSYFSGVALGLGIGAMLSIGGGSREIFYLPVSRKDVWRTRWILALVPVILIAMIRCWCLE
jgi:hypothetical protein